MAAKSLATYRSSLRDVLRCLAIVVDPQLADEDVRALDSAAQALTADVMTVDNLRMAFAKMQAGAFRTTCPGTPRSNRSMRVLWASVNGFCIYLTRLGAIGGSPMAGVDIAARTDYRPAALAEADAQALLIAAGAPPGRNIRIRWPLRDVAIVATGLLLGARAGELRSLTVGALSGTSGSTSLRLGDRGPNQRTLPVPTVLEVALARYLEDRAAGPPRSLQRRVSARNLQQDSSSIARMRRIAKSELLFVTTAGEPMNEAHLYNVVDHIYADAGLAKDVCGASGLIQALRNTFIMGLSEAGTPRDEMETLLGDLPPQNTTLRDYRNVRVRLPHS